MGLRISEFYQIILTINAKKKSLSTIRADSAYSRNFRPKCTQSFVFVFFQKCFKKNEIFCDVHKLQPFLYLPDKYERLTVND